MDTEPLRAPIDVSSAKKAAKTRAPTPDYPFLQAQASNAFPAVKVVHGKELVGQVYIPSVNYVLMIPTILLVAIFQSGTALTAAFGATVAGSFLCTTIVFTTYLAKYAASTSFSSFPLYLSLFLLVLDNFCAPYSRRARCPPLYFLTSKHPIRWCAARNDMEHSRNSVRQLWPGFIGSAPPVVALSFTTTAP